MAIQPNTLVLDHREGLITPKQYGLGAIALDGYYIEHRREAGHDTQWTADRLRGILNSNFVSAHQADWINVPADKDVIVDCSDDRSITAESAEAIQQQLPENMLDPLEGTASVFGGLSGAVLASLFSGVAQYGPKYITQSGGFFGIARKLLNNPSQDASFGIHSAEAAEGNPQAFDPDSEKTVACAFNEAVGMVVALLSQGPNGAISPDAQRIQDVARRDQHLIFGENDVVVDALFKAAYHVAEHLASMTNTKQVGDFKIDRLMYVAFQNMTERTMPIPVLQGQHKPAAETGVIYNFNVNQAGRAGNFYRGGVGRVTDEILKAVPGDLSPELIMRSIKLLDGPTRAVLYAHDPVHGGRHGPLDPEGLPMAWIGDPWNTIQKLTDRYSSN